MPGNQDIDAEFPGTLNQYRDLKSSKQNLDQLVTSHEVGSRELFVVMAGSITVGQAIITVIKQPPEQVDPSWPNVSGWIVGAFRGQGLGKLSLQKRLEIVCEHFDGKAWTLVNKANHVSEANVLSAGFSRTEAVLTHKPDHNLFTWERN
ncbi:MAG: hypothetical protein ACR2FM_02070 [Candidatus Saccharimonadales bacterium]